MSPKRQTKPKRQTNLATDVKVMVTYERVLTEAADGTLMITDKDGGPRPISPEERAWVEAYEHRLAEALADLLVAAYRRTHGWEP